MFVEFNIIIKELLWIKWSLLLGDYDALIKKWFLKPWMLGLGFIQGVIPWIY
jgi:hypothetical protein